MSGKKPEKVLKAIEEGDTSTLQAMGKAGGIKAGALSAERADFRALNEADQKEAEHKFILGAKEHEDSMLKNVHEHDQ